MTQIIPFKPTGEPWVKIIGYKAFSDGQIEAVDMSIGTGDKKVSTTFISINGVLLKNASIEIDHDKTLLVLGEVEE